MARRCYVSAVTLRLITKLSLPVCAWIAFCAVVVTCSAADTTKLDFNFQIRPLLSDRCFRCHGPDSAARKAKLRLDQRDGALKSLDDGMAVVKPGDLEHSELIRRILTDNEDDLMPPPDSHLTLTTAAGKIPRRRTGIAEPLNGTKKHAGIAAVR